MSSTNHSTNDIKYTNVDNSYSEQNINNDKKISVTRYKTAPVKTIQIYFLFTRSVPNPATTPPHVLLRESSKN